MSCFKLKKKKNSLDAMNSIASNFWWEQINGKNKIYWMSCAKMCKGKSHGEYGFRDLNKFNLALLAKIGWRLITNPDILWANIIKGFYFPNGDFLRAKVGWRASWGWRSILAGGEVICLIVYKQVGDGCRMNIWKDPWIPNLPSHKICSIKPPKNRSYVSARFEA